MFAAFRLKLDQMIPIALMDRLLRTIIDVNEDKKVIRDKQQKARLAFSRKVIQIYFNDSGRNGPDRIT